VAFGIDIAGVQTEVALVDVRAGCPGTGVTSVARAGEGTLGVGASCMIVAVVRPLEAFVDVDTRDTIAGKAFIACTGERADVVAADLIAVVGTLRALVDVEANNTIATETGVAIASV
jgi:hypothetical protein